ncbi:hypothetical protein LDENG_00132150 [Lucifuga dentata]|nr:hypothetical protein LDENG_00132150 [Lucifuga dentata]
MKRRSEWVNKKSGVSSLRSIRPGRGEDAVPAGHAALRGPGADGCRGGHGSVHRPVVWTRALSGPGGRGAGGHWAVHGNEESPGGSAGAFPPAPTHGDALQPTAGPCHTKEVGPDASGDVRGLCQQQTGA